MPSRSAAQRLAAAEVVHKAEQPAAATAFTDPAQCLALGVSLPLSPLDLGRLHRLNALRRRARDRTD